MFAAGAFAQAKQVRGSVVDENGAAVIGASVIVKGTTIGVSTDQQGFFVMNNVPAKSEELQISYLGYKTATVAVAKAADVMNRGRQIMCRQKAKTDKDAKVGRKLL